MPRRVTPPSRGSAGLDGGGLLDGAAPAPSRAPPEGGRGPVGGIARVPLAEAGAPEEAQRARRGSGSPEGERAGRPAAVRASERKSAGRAHAPSQKGETAAGPLSTHLEKS